MSVEPAIDSCALVITEIEQMGGAERSLLALSSWLFRHHVPHHFVTYEDRAGLAAQADYPLTVVQLKPTMRAAKKISALRRYFAPRKGGPQPLTSGYQPAMHATLAGLRGFHCLMHDTPSLFDDAASAGLKQQTSRWLSDKVTGYGLRSGGATIVTSEYLRAESQRVFGVKAQIARMGGLAGETFHRRPVRRELRLLSVSRIEGNKRIDWMLRALAEMESEGLSERVDWRLDLTGRGAQLEAMRSLAAALGLGARVQFHGYVSDSELQRLYAEAHLFLMPAVQGYGIPAIEALQRGLPVLLHRDSGVSDILLDTPWATVIHGDERGMLPGLQKAIGAVVAGVQLQAPVPCLPTEDEWAERVARLCGWV
jgi:glycosyltransferase involved in cell wall biosynthesis